MLRRPHRALAVADAAAPYTLADASAYLESRTEQLATGSGVSWALADPVTGELLGAIAAFDLVAGRDAEIGYWTHPAARGRGLMTEALGLVLRQAFTPVAEGGLGLVRVAISAADGNTASLHVWDRGQRLCVPAGAGSGARSGSGTAAWWTASATTCCWRRYAGSSSPR